jgi:preprotein translocase subunit YajC
MKLRLLPATFAVLAVTAVAVAQDPGSAPPAGQNSTQNSGQGNGGGYGQRGGRGGGGGMGGGMGMMGRGLMGTVTEAAADHFTIKTEMGEMYTVHFSADTRIVKQPAGTRGPGGGGGGGGQGNGGGGYGRGGNGGNPPQEIKAADIKVGDAIVAAGDIDATAKSVGATRIMQLDPESTKRMQELAASFGKTWLQGKVTAINGTTITLTGALDNAPHTVVADENTTFRRRRDPITLADIQVGETVRAEGAVKDGAFAATALSVGGGMGGPPSNGPSGGPSGPPPQ